MSNGKPLSLIKNTNQYFAFPLDNCAEPKLPYRSSVVARVIKIPHHPSRHHYSSQRINRVSSITDVQSKNVLHITIRSARNIRCTDSKPVNSQNKKNSEQQQQHNSNNNNGSTNTKEKKQVYNPLSLCEIDHQQKSINNDLSTPDDLSNISIKNTWSDKNASTKEFHRNRHRNKVRTCLAQYCSNCSCLHVILSLLVTLILGIAIAAALVGSLITNKTTTTLAIPTNTSTMTDLPTTEIATTESITISITLLTTTTEIVYGVWNTTAGGDSTPSTVGSGVGNYYTGQMANNVFDNQTNTIYTSFGTCIFGAVSSLECGKATGLYLTPQQGSSLLLSFQFCTGNDYPNRDPLTITVEGSNQSSSLLTLGSSWTLIYNGSTGLQSILSRNTYGAIQSVSNNSIQYSSYRILVTSKRGSEFGTQYSEVKLMGYL